VSFIYILFSKKDTHRIALLTLALVQLVDALKGVEGLLIITLGHEELGTLGQKNVQEAAEQTGHRGDRQEDLPGANCRRKMEFNIEVTSCRILTYTPKWPP